MKFNDITKVLDCAVHYKSKSYDTGEILHVAAGDLMSEVLVVDEEGVIIVTALTSDQVVRTADIVGALGIIIVNGKSPQEEARRLAVSCDVTLLSTRHSLFSTCCLLGKILERGQ